jgi:hypothetical protein
MSLDHAVQRLEMLEKQCYEKLEKQCPIKHINTTTNKPMHLNRKTIDMVTAMADRVEALMAEAVEKVEKKNKLSGLVMAAKEVRAIEEAADEAWMKAMLAEQ